jgi:hypothetical protein
MILGLYTVFRTPPFHLRFDSSVLIYTFIYFKCCICDLNIFCLIASWLSRWHQLNCYCLNGTFCLCLFVRVCVGCPFACDYIIIDLSAVEPLNIELLLLLLLLLLLCGCCPYVVVIFNIITIIYAGLCL